MEYITYARKQAVSEGSSLLSTRFHDLFVDLDEQEDDYWCDIDLEDEQDWQELSLSRFGDRLVTK